MKFLKWWRTEFCGILTSLLRVTSRVPQYGSFVDLPRISCYLFLLFFFFLFLVPLLMKSFFAVTNFDYEREQRRYEGRFLDSCAIFFFFFFLCKGRIHQPTFTSKNVVGNYLLIKDEQIRGNGLLNLKV